MSQNPPNSTTSGRPLYGPGIAFTNEDYEISRFREIVNDLPKLIDVLKVAINQWYGRKKKKEKKFFLL